MDTNLLIVLAVGGVLTLLLLGGAMFLAPNTDRKAQQRLEKMRDRVSNTRQAAARAQMRKLLMQKQSGFETAIGSFIPRPAELRKRLKQTGKEWTLGQYAIASAGIGLVTYLAAWLLLGMPAIFALFAALLLGIGLPHMVVGFLINRRIAKFINLFPDAIDLMVRGLRSGLPITEAINVAGKEVPAPVGTEFATVADQVRIGRTLDQALQMVGQRIPIPEFQFFVITLAIQRETGGNLAETLNNLSDVLRKRQQMKLKIKAMSSESKASAYIVGSLPFMVFGIIYFINPEYMGGFFSDLRLIMAGLGGMLWMGIGIFIMWKMVNFEI